MAGKRLPTRERKEQIIGVTLQLIAQHGVTGTTLARIAAAIGVTTPALYAHFSGRKEILLAALDELVKRRTASHRLRTEGNGLERLRRIGLAHTAFVSSPEDTSVLALFGLISAPPEEGLREAVAAKHLLLVDEIANVVREGQEEGSIAAHADPQLTAWMIVSRAWTEDIAYLMGIPQEWNETRSHRMLDLILAFITSPAPSSGEEVVSQLAASTPEGVA